MATIKVKISKKGEFELPADHKPAMKVATGGSCCANCKYWDGDDCENKYYRKWNNGNGSIPYAANEYCSDWWEPK